MRRVTLMLAALAIMVALFTVAAYAATIEGTGNSEKLNESDLNDTIYGCGGNDTIYAHLYSADKDVLYGNHGADFLRADDTDTQDTLDGGSGYDICFGDAGDKFLDSEDID